MVCHVCYKPGNNSNTYGRGDRCGCQAPTLFFERDSQTKVYDEFVTKYYALQDEVKALRHLILDMNPALSHRHIDGLLGD